MLRWLELKLPPLLLLVLVGMLMALSTDQVPELRRVPALRLILAGLYFVKGVVIAVAGVAAFRRAATTVDPRYPERSSELVVSGIYRYTRNPMYLGMAFVLLAFALYLGSWLAVLYLAVFMVYMTRFQILPEERVMNARFGDAYTGYRATVRRWL